MSILTKKVTMTETAWAEMSRLLEGLRRAKSLGHPYYAMSNVHQPMDVSDAITALAEAETVAVTDTYSRIADAQRETDQWLRDAEQQGCRCGVCDNG